MNSESQPGPSIKSESATDNERADNQTINAEFNLASQPGPSTTDKILAEYTMVEATSTRVAELATMASDGSIVSATNTSATTHPRDMADALEARAGILVVEHPVPGCM